VVHTNDLDVTVLGTQFNVNNRGDQVKVVLNSGKVKVKVAHAVSGNEIFMEPGEMVAYDTHRKLIGKQIVNPEIYSSWRDNYLVFDDAPLHEVAETLENTYGLQITFENESLSQEIIRGTVPSDDIEILLESLSHIFNLEITQENNKIFIAKK
jgi:ferric-dicitrate binding protein FerR (iron transport regulator)